MSLAPTQDVAILTAQPQGQCLPRQLAIREALDFARVAQARQVGIGLVAAEVTRMLILPVHPLRNGIDHRTQEMSRLLERDFSGLHRRHIGMRPRHAECLTLGVELDRLAAQQYPARRVISQAHAHFLLEDCVPAAQIGHQRLLQ